ncbi:FAD/NAD(P)-binding protein [Actinomadura syzygii]|uniref:NADPH-dependent L-lysine N(6)-monooxygenase n=1 Tax=Actinomadura syzygii TaxID=1427538 RepID=A0A5D0UJV1_9ACTN|nr:FAD/NAD(P)-binding protein [Actinomadura syzygii]TYC18801.1 NADPH-dependent L-lysine N(6)-monooxygenase [Actinomadura syzygii]
MDIAIVGAGAAAVGLLDALDPSVVTSVTVFEPASTLWRGRPYQPDLDSVLVNAPPEIMSIRSGDREHYARWLGGRCAGFADERLGRPIPPRAVYGRYLAETAEAALARFARTKLVRVAVTGVSLGERLSVRTSDGRVHEADQVVLCVGGGTPLDHYGLAGEPGFVADPYPLERTLADVPPGRDVAVIGAGLTAVDVVASLAARGHTGRISLVSRSGTLPFVWQRPVETGIRRLTPERLLALPRPVTLEHVIELVRAELADHGESWDDLAAWTTASARRDPVESLREQLAMVDAPLLARRIVQEAAHTAGPVAWRLLPVRDRELLRARHFRTITTLASPMVPRNAAVLLDLLDAGTLETLSGIERIEAGDGFRIVHAAGERTAAVVVNAVNPPPHAIPRAARPLVSSLLRQGAELDPDGGLAADPDTGRIMVGGRPDPRLHVVGDLAGGGPFLVSGIPGVAVQAARAARSLGSVDQPVDQLVK